MDFFSARLLYLIRIDKPQPRRRHSCDETVVVFRARDWSHAFARALELGRAAEVSYENQYGERVRWSLAEIVHLDIIGPTIDGAEVSSRLHTRVWPEAISSRTRLHPERSQPVESAPAGPLVRSTRRKKSSAKRAT